jgi:beta-glucanase (GH16 family)
VHLHTKPKATVTMTHRTLAPLLLAVFTGITTAAPVAQLSFKDDLTTFDTARWMRADGWTNGAPFDNAWKADHLTTASSLMSIRLDNVTALGKPYTSGQYQTSGYHGYGCYETRMRPVSAAGVVSSFFTFAGPYDNGGNGRHNEIDIEFVGSNTRRFQANFWTNDDTYAGGNEHLVDLPFDAAQGLHQYAFKWTSTGIEWFVDGVSVYKVLDSALKPTPKAGDSLHKIMVNLWPVDSTAAGWAGSFVYPGTPLSSTYDWIKYTAGETCTVSPLAAGSAATDVHVQGISLALVNKNTQATAKVLVLDGLGRPVQSVKVNGTWTGAITGTSSGLTDATGNMTVTSASSTKTGKATFCATGLTAAGLVYVSSANAATCVSITK